MLALTAVNLRGITRTAGLTRILVACSLAALAVVVVAILSSGSGGLCQPGARAYTAGPTGSSSRRGLLFFAFAGYARIATLGEEVRDPERTIPRAIPLALGITVAIYACRRRLRAPGSRFGRSGVELEHRS